MDVEWRGNWAPKFFGPHGYFSTPILPEVIFLTPAWGRPTTLFFSPPDIIFLAPSARFFDTRNDFFDPQLPH